VAVAVSRLAALVAQSSLRKGGVVMSTESPLFHSVG
jgi:hypothetical protein